MADSRKVVRFVFGNHKHWTGMVWEWGEDTLVNSTTALRRILAETGLKSGLNFDGRGIEQLAVFHPQSIAWLREALKDGRIEIWGGTYTQPYGGLIGAESNIRQRVQGIRTFERILGARPKVFAEEEFDFFPQLPQLLVQLGYESALLFPQHTWHTPTFPKETAPVVLWQGIDGSQIAAVPFSDRCLIRGIPTALRKLQDPAFSEADEPLMITWLEALDKPNWMWRTDYVLSYLRELQSQKDIEIRPTLLSEYTKQRASDAPVRQYSLDDCFHGVSSGKNGDALPRLWRKCERELVWAEFVASWCSFLGQPYPQFDSYPGWQLEEAWRNLMMSQGHDAYECEGFTNQVGHRFAQTAIMLANDVVARCENRLQVKYAPVAENNEPPLKIFDEDDRLVIQVASIRAELNKTNGTLESYQYKSEQLLADPVGLPAGFRPTATPTIATRQAGLFITTPIEGRGFTGTLGWRFVKPLPWIRGQVVLHMTEPLPPGIMNSIMLPIRFQQRVTHWRVDTPFAVLTLNPNGEWLHRQPTGHWLTSEQAEEFVPNPIVHNSFVFAAWHGVGLQYVSWQNNLAIAKENGFDSVIFGRDAWDQDNYARDAVIDFALIPQPADVHNLALLQTAELAMSGRKLPCFANNRFCTVHGYAHISCIRKVAEELEIRLFETEGEPADVTIDFLWPIESARSVTPLGDQIHKDIHCSGRSLAFALRPREIATLRILFDGKRTEYLPIDDYRNVWVG